MENGPPLVLDSARVVSYVIVPDEVLFTGRASVFVDRVPLGRVPRLAICQNFGLQDDFLLLYCDDEWNSVGAGGGESVDDVKAYAETNYPGLSSFWIDLEFSEEEALRYYDESSPESRCRVCGKRAFELETMVELPTGMVCEECGAGPLERGSS